jgi:CRISPR-associated protein Csm1
MIYAGGDDAALVGELDALEYVGKIAMYAEKWGFTTAIGIKIDEPQLPIYYAWTEVNERLKKAKRDREQSIAVVITDPVEISFNAKELSNLYSIASPEHLEKEEAKRLLRVVYTKLFQAHLLTQSKTSQIQNRSSNKLSPDIRRELTRTLIELAYILNRRGDDAQQVIDVIKTISGLNISPEQLPTLYNNLVKQDQETINKLRTAIFGIYLIHLREKKTKE